MEPFLTAVIGNPKHLEYGVATIPLPIPDEEYDHCLELLAALDIGSATERDCWIDDLENRNPMLKCLAGTIVNIDELDYFAKRLDGFTDYEMTQFQAEAAYKGFTDITDLINLTFCSQEVTVIKDFTNLERAGRNHYLTVHGGSVLSTTYKQLDGSKLAAELLQSGEGKITPHGVLFENGMEMAQVYDGRHLPEYYYEPSEITIRIASPGSPEKCELLYFPCPDTKIDRAIWRMEADELYDYSPEIEITEHMSQEVQDLFTAYGELGLHLFTLNHLAKCYKGFDEKALESFNALVDYADPQTPDEVLSLAENLYDFTFVKGIHTPEEYGWHVILESGHYDLDPDLACYMDYRRFGENRVSMEEGVFTEQGYIAYLGTDPVVEEILARNGQEEQQVFDQQMGGMG